MESFAEHVEQLRQVRDEIELVQGGMRFTQARLISEAADYSQPGTSQETIRNAVTGRRGGGIPSIPAITAIAQALKTSPDTFVAYRIQRARELLDEELVGLAAAAANAEILLSRSAEIPEDVAEEAARQRKAKPAVADASDQRPRRKGRAA